MKKIILILFLSLSLLHADNQTLRITSGFDYPETNLIHSVLKEGFKRAKIGLEYHTLPNQRSLINANRGIYDGEAARIWEINELYPNLVRIPVSIHAIDLVVLSRKKIFITKASDLKNYHVGVIRGMKIAEKMAKDAKPLSITTATNHITLVKMLSNDRLDLILTNKIGLLTDLSKSIEKGFYLVEKPILSRPLYMHLHKKHKNLIPKLEKAFESMIEDGTYQKIQDSFLSDIENKIKDTLKVIKDDSQFSL